MLGKALGMEFPCLPTDGNMFMYELVHFYEYNNILLKKEWGRWLKCLLNEQNSLLHLVQDEDKINTVLNLQIP
jgi:hypothetical protein